MACNNNNPTVIQWLNGKTTEYDVSDLPSMRKPASDGSGFLYLNTNRIQSDKYEKPRDIVRIPPDLMKARQQREEAKSIRSASIVEEKRTPAHLRLHQHYSY